MAIIAILIFLLLIAKMSFGFLSLSSCTSDVSLCQSFKAVLPLISPSPLSDFKDFSYKHFRDTLSEILLLIFFVKELELFVPESCVIKLFIRAFQLQKASASFRFIMIGNSSLLRIRVASLNSLSQLAVVLLYLLMAVNELV